MEFFATALYIMPVYAAGRMVLAYVISRIPTIVYITARAELNALRNQNLQPPVGALIEITRLEHVHLERSRSLCRWAFASGFFGLATPYITMWAPALAGVICLIGIVVDNRLALYRSYGQRRLAEVRKVFPPV